MILDRRIGRDFRENLLRNLSMIFIIALSMSLVVSLCSSTDCIVQTIEEEWRACRLEDGSFDTYIPLSKRNFQELSEIPVQIEQMFYTDVAANGTSTLRIFPNRKKIDLPYPERGRIPQADREVFLEKKYAARKSLTVGSVIAIGGQNFNVCGIGCLPDYGYVKQNTSDVAANDEFSVAVVTDRAWSDLCGGGKVIYHYAYRLGEGCSVRDLKKKLLELKFDPAAVKDTYLKGMQQAESAELAAYDEALSALKNGAMAVSDGLQGVMRAQPENKGTLGSLRDGALGIYAGIEELQENLSEIGENGTQDAVTLLSDFGETKYNIRVTDAVDDSTIGKQSALVVGVFLVILLVYMLSVFAAGTIEKERPVIGTLYALGYRRNEILSHYLKMPMLTAAIGAVAGTVGGFLLTDTMAASSAELYSFPELRHVFPAYLLAYSLGLPTVFSYLMNRMTLSKKLDAMPLQMMREAPQNVKKSTLSLEGLPFAKKYQLRQFLRELSGNLTLFFGIFVSLVLILFSVACYSSIKGYIDGITDDVHYEYLYLLRNPVSDLPKNSCVGYTRGFYADYPMTGGEMEVTLQGIGSDNPYFPFAGDLGEDADRIYISSSARIKFGYRPGDRIVLRDQAGDALYAFEIAGEVPYGNGLYFFMNLDAMRKAFGLDYFKKEDLKKGERPPKAESFYYNTIFSNTKLEIRHNMLLSEVSKTEIKSGVEKFMTLMWGMIVMMIAVSVIIFAAVMYLLMKLEIDRSSFSVSLLKALGYPEKTVNSFYLGGSFYITLAALIFGLPVGTVIVCAAYPFCVSNVNAGFAASISPVQYGLVILIVMGTYFATRFFLEKYLKKINLTEILKNRE